MFLNELCIYSYNAESFRQLNSHFINVSYSYCILFCEKHIPKDVPVKMAVRNLYDSDKRCKLESSFFPPHSCLCDVLHHVLCSQHTIQAHSENLELLYTYMEADTGSYLCEIYLQQSAQQHCRST